MSCPCGSGKPLEECCGVYIRGEARPETAEALMRARYTAYATGEVDYVLSTHDPERNGEVDRSSTELWSKKSEWLGLEILNTQGGGPLDDSGTVEFVARYKIRGTTVTHRERGTFRRHNGNWVFVDGEQVSGPPVVREGPRIGRNHPCPCGSGKKYKKCCGAGGGSAVVRAGQS